MSLDLTKETAGSIVCLHGYENRPLCINRVLNDTQAECLWFDDNGQLHGEIFKGDVLSKYKSKS